MGMNGCECPLIQFNEILKRKYRFKLNRFTVDRMHFHSFVPPDIYVYMYICVCILTKRYEINEDRIVYGQFCIPKIHYAKISGQRTKVGWCKF